MATTTNYSWTTPDDTDLVKDGAAAIRTLGSSADTTVKALNPGTTAGDIDYYTTSTTKARVGIGTAGQLLSVNSGATAPEWITVSSGAMTLLSTTTLSGTTTTVSGISGSYIDLIVMINNPHVNTSTPLRINANGTAGIGNAMSVTGDEGAKRSIQLQATESTLKNVSTPGASYILHIYQYANTSYGKPFYYSGADADQFESFVSGGAISTTSAITSLAFTTVSGTATFSGGQVLIYGVK